MKYSTKAALLSGLIFPGTGQILLKRYMRGIALMMTIFVCLGYIIMHAVAQAFAIVEKMELQDGTVDMNAITQAATQASQNSGSMLGSLAFLLIIACWVFAVVDAYILGKDKDRASGTMQ